MRNKIIKSEPFNGKTIEEYWTELITKHLVGKKITKVEYIPVDEAEENMWYKRPIAILLDDKDWIFPTMDDEGNDGGAMHTTMKDLQCIPVIS